MNDQKGRLFTARSILLAIIATLLMGAGGQYVNKYIPGVKGLVRGHLPISVFGFAILFAMVINPLIGRIRAAWRLTASEIALILAGFLVGCAITDAGLMRHYPRVLVHPIQQNRSFPGWQKVGALESTPKGLLANDGKYSTEVVDNYMSQMGRKGHPISIKQVPWGAWLRPLVFWTSLICLVMVGYFALGVVLHSQWANRERVRYPIAALASSFLVQDDNGIPVIARNRIFWLGFIIPFAIRVLNGVALWLPNSLSIPLTFDFSAFAVKFPEFMKTPGASVLTSVTLFPACIGFAFLLASEISLSVGVSGFVGVFLLYLLMNAGVNVSGGKLTGDIMQWGGFGAFLGMALMLIYIGRKHYLDSLKAAIGFSSDDSDKSSAMALRIFLAAFIGAVILLSLSGLDWPIALLALLLVYLSGLVISRLNAEAGVFFISSSWSMPAVIVGLFSLETLGPTLVIVLGLTMYVLCIDQFETAMPFVMNSLKITSDTKLPAGSSSFILGSGLLIAIVIAVVTGLWADYNWAAETRRGWDTTDIYNTAERTATSLIISGELEKVRNYGIVERILAIKPDFRFITASLIGCSAILILSFLRLRFPGWPFHPVLILCLNSGMGKFSASFLLGWLIKTAVNKYAGAGVYVKMKPFMMGLIVGDLSGAFMIMLVNWIYYAATGMAGPAWLLW